MGNMFGRTAKSAALAVVTRAHAPESCLFLLFYTLTREMKAMNTYARLVQDCQPWN